MKPRWAWLKLVSIMDWLKSKKVTNEKAIEKARERASQRID